MFDKEICLSSSIYKEVINELNEECASGTNVDIKNTENYKKSNNNAKESIYSLSIEDRTGISIVDRNSSNYKSSNIVNTYNDANINGFSSETKLVENQALEITSKLLSCSDITKEPFNLNTKDDVKNNSKTISYSKTKMANNNTLNICSKNNLDTCLDHLESVSDYEIYLNDDDFEDLKQYASIQNNKEIPLQKLIDIEKTRVSGNVINDLPNTNKNEVVSSIEVFEESPESTSLSITKNKKSKDIVEMAKLLKKAGNTQSNDVEPLVENECYVINNKKNSHKDQNERSHSKEISEKAANIENGSLEPNAASGQKNLDELNKILLAIKNKSRITTEMIKDIISNRLHSAQDTSYNSRSDDGSNYQESYFNTPAPNTVCINPKDPCINKIKPTKNFKTHLSDSELSKNKLKDKMTWLRKLAKSYINASDNPNTNPLAIFKHIANQKECTQDNLDSHKETNFALKQCDNQLNSSKKSLKKRKTENLLSIESKFTETKKARFSELERLQADINDSFIRNDVLNARGRRICSIKAEKITQRQLKGWNGNASNRTFTLSKASDMADIKPRENKISGDPLKVSGADDNLLIPTKSVPFLEQSKHKKKTPKRRKNNNIDHHCRSNFINSCLLCNESSNSVVSHYINEHRATEVYISRLTQSDIYGLLKTPNFGHRIIELPNKFESMCVFCCKVSKSTISSWIEHFTSHTGEFAFECSECCVRFFKESQINRHLKECVKGSYVLHNYSYNSDVVCILGFSCKICNFTQLHKANIIKHLKTEHELKIISDANVNEFKLFEIKDDIIPVVEMRNETNSDNIDSNESDELVTVNYPSNILTESIDLKPIIFDSSEDIENLEWNKSLRLADTSSLCDLFQGNITTRVTDISETSVCLTNTNKVIKKFDKISKTTDFLKEEQSDLMEVIQTPQIDTSNIEGQIKEEPSGLTNLEIINSRDTIVQNEYTISTINTTLDNLKKEQEIEEKLFKDKDFRNNIRQNCDNKLNMLFEPTKTDVVVILHVENMGYHKMPSKLINYYCSFKGCEFPATTNSELLCDHINKQHNQFWSGWCFICRKQTIEKNKYSLDLELNHLYMHSLKLNINQIPFEIQNNNCFKTVELAIPQSDQRHTNVPENILQCHANYCSFKPWQPKNGHKSVNISILYSFKDLMKKYKCVVNNCFFTSDSKPKFTFHLNEHLNNTLSKFFGFECCYCSHIGSNNNDLVTHIDFEHSASIYQCSLCFYRARSEYATKYHQSLLHSQTINTGEILCVGKQSANHLEIVMSLVCSMEQYVKPILCEDCGASYYTLQAYNNHKKTVHFVNSEILQLNIGLFVCIFCIYETNEKLKIISHTIHQHPNNIPCFAGRLVNKKSIQYECVDETSIGCISLICLDESVKCFLQYMQPAFNLNISLDTVISYSSSCNNLEMYLKELFEDFSNTNFITSEIPDDQKCFIRESCRIFEILTRNSGLIGKNFFHWKNEDGSLMEFANRDRWISHLLCLKNAKLLHENIIYDCPHCEKGFYLKDLFQHMVKHLKHRCICLHCGETTIINRDIIKLHLLKKHDNENVYIKKLMKDEYQIDNVYENYYYVCSYTHIGDNLIILLKQTLNVSMQSINNYKNGIEFLGCLQQYIPEHIKYNCYELNCRFSGKECRDIREHYYSKHENIKTFICKYCNYKFNKTDDYLFLQEIEEHLTYHSKYIINCKGCKYVAANMSNLITHVELYHDTQSIFIKTENIQNSLITNTTYLTYKNYITNIIACPYCTLQYTKIDLANHIYQSHGQNPEYHCGYCGEISYFYKEAENHLIKLHTGKEIVFVSIHKETLHLKYPEKASKKYGKSTKT